MTTSSQNNKLQAQLDPFQATFRSGAVARMAGMPVSTLRIWEQRYQVVGPTTAASGHRLYSAADVERVVQLRQLTLGGHAISSVAQLNMEQLHHLAQTQASSKHAEKVSQPSQSSALRIVVVGGAMERRLRHLSVLDCCAIPLQIVGVFHSLYEASQAAPATSSSPIDLLLWRAATLQDNVAADLKAARAAWRAREVAVTYRFAVATARDALVSAGASVVREPSDDGALAAWLSSFRSSSFPATKPPSDVGTGSGFDRRLFDVLTSHAGVNALPARRFEDSALTEFAGLSSRLTCECPGHVAELLMQISSFEAYSEGCVKQNSADAELHADLQRVAGAARMLFEAALERVALAEGMALP